MRVRRIKIGIRRPEESLKEAKEVVRRLKAGEKLPERGEELYLLIWLRCAKSSRQSDWHSYGPSWNMRPVRCGSWPSGWGGILRTSARILPFFPAWGWSS